jgi:hypothetical protein
MALFTGVIAFLAVTFVIRLALLPTDDPAPDGPSCAYRPDPSGPIAVGVERINWWPSPERICVTADGDSVRLPAALDDLAIAFLGVAAGGVALTATARWILR